MSVAGDIGAQGRATASALQVRLRRAIGRLRLYLMLEGLLALVGFVVGLSVLQFVFDYYSRGLQWSMRAALLVVLVGGTIWLLVRRVIEPWRVRVEPADLAHWVERRHRELGGVLVTAVRYGATEGGAGAAHSPALVASAVQCAAEKTKPLDFQDVLKPSRPRWASVGIVVLVGACAGVAGWQPELTGLWFARSVLLQEVEWPRRTKLVVELREGALMGARGDDLVVQAWAEGVQPREVEIRFLSASGRSGRESMTTVGNPGGYRYRYTFPAVQEDLRIQLHGGDDHTAWIPVRLVDRPQVVESRVRLTPPSYTRQERVQLGDQQRVIRVLKGTEVSIGVRLNKPVERATLLSGTDALADARMEEGWYTASVRALENATLHFDLRDEYGFDDRRPSRFSLRVIADEAPVVRLAVPGVGELVTPGAVLPMEVEYRDGYGLASAELNFSLTRKSSGAAENGTIGLSRFRPGPAQYSESLSWAVMNQGLAPGDQLSLLARAGDYDDVGGPNVGQSNLVALRVVTVEEFLAELARREQEYRMDLERLVDAQERIRGELLTWLRESESGASADSRQAALVPLERRQRHIAASLNVLRQQFDAVLAELRVNQLDVREERERLEDGIIQPLGRLGGREGISAAELIREWSRDGSAELGRRADHQLVQLLEEMRLVLARMIQWEGYHEVVNMLRDILRLQRELEEETRKAHEREVEGLFED